MNKAENINLEPINLSILNVMQFIKNGCYIKILHCSLEKIYPVLIVHIKFWNKSKTNYFYIALSAIVIYNPLSYTKLPKAIWD